MVSIIKYIYEDEGIMNGLINATKRAVDPDTVKEAGSATKRLVGKLGRALSRSGETTYDLLHDKETGASLGGSILKTKNATGLEDAANRFELAKAVSSSSNPEIKQQWGKFLKKR